MFNRLLSRLGDQEKAVERPESFSKNHDQTEQKDPKAAEGFLCPACYSAFPTAVLLQNHYESSHPAGLEELETKGDFYVCSSCKMKFGSEIELNSHFSRHHAADNDQAETESLRMQVQALMEGKALLQNEMESVRKQLIDSVRESSKLDAEKKALGMKSAELASELANVKASYDEQTTANKNLESFLRDSEKRTAELQLEIQQRPSTDDVNVLKDELVKVQKMMDQMTLEKEAEKDILHKENSYLKQMCEKLETEKNTLTATLERTTKERESSQSETAEREKTIKSLQKKLDESEATLKKEIDKNSEYELIKKVMTDLSLILSTGQRDVPCNKDNATNIYEAVKLLKSQVAEKDTLLKELRAELEKRKNYDALKEQCLHLSGEATTWKFQAEENLKLFETAKKAMEDMLSKIKEGEGGSAAMAQLQEENSQVRIQVAATNFAYVQNVTVLQIQIEELEEKHEKMQKALEEKLSELESKLVSLSNCIQLKKREVSDLKWALKQKEKVCSSFQSELDAVHEELQHMKISSFEFISSVQDMLVAALKNDSYEIDLQLQDEELQLHFEKFAEIAATITECTSKEETLKSLFQEVQELSEIIKLKDGEISSLSGCLKASETSLQEATAKLNRLSNENTELVALREECAIRLDEVIDEKKELTEKISELELIKKKLIEAKEELSASIVSRDEEIKSLHSHIEDLQKQHDKIREAKSEIAKLKFENSTLKTSNKEQSDKVQCLSKKRDELENQIKRLKASRNELSMENEAVTTSLRHTTEEMRRLRKKVAELEKCCAEIENVKGEFELLKIENEELASSKLECLKKLSEAHEEMKKLQEKFQEVELINESIMMVKNEVSASLLAREEQIKSLDVKLLDLQQKYDDIQQKNTSLHSEVESKNQECKDLGENVRMLSSDLSKVLDEKNKAVDDLTAAKQLMVDQNVKFQKEICALKDINEKELETLREKLSVSNQELEILQKMKQQLVFDLNKVESEFEKQTKVWEQSAFHYEAQLSVLTENSNTLKEDLQAELAHCKKLEEKLDEISGTKLELQAKLENVLEERRALLDRCLKSEAECEKLMKINGELHAKLEDSNAALHELGRENQSLQMELGKHVGRKWADDSEATHCTACGKAFTVTVRKHHCRSCGKIFCNECSSKTAAVASSKKPVRVCDMCHRDLTK